GRSKRPEARDSAQSAEIKVIQDAGLEPEVSRERSGRSPWIQWAAILLTVFLAIQLLMVAGAIFLRLLPIFLLVIFAALLAFMLAPLVRGLIAVGFPRTLAAITVYLGIFLLLGLLISWLSGPASQQVTNLVKSYPSYLNQVTASTG